MSPVDTCDDYAARRVRIPLRRIGMLLGTARARRGESRSDVGQRSGLRFGPGLLAQIEEGRHEILESDVPALAEAYGIDLDDILPDRDRLEVDLRRRRLRAGRALIKIPRGLTLDEILDAYVAFVRSLRGLPAGAWVDPVTLRVDDIVELALAADVVPAEIEQRLVDRLQSVRPTDGSAAVWSATESRYDRPPGDRPDLRW